VSKIGIIPVPKQRELVNMLFWWEEELTRWRLLDEEEAEIVKAISARDNGAQDGEAELQERLRVIEAKQRVVPSLRRADGSLKTVEGQPPQYVP
jgi:adenylate kinase family enzyme